MYFTEKTMAEDTSKLIKELIKAQTESGKRGDKAAQVATETAAEIGEDLSKLIAKEMEGAELAKEERQALLEGIAGNSTRMAEGISKKLGQEEAITRELEHQMTTLFSKDAEARIVMQKGTESDKAVMLEMMKAEAMANMHMTKDFIAKNHDFISSATQNVTDKMGEIVEKSASIFHPLVGNITRAMDDFRHSIVESAPILGRFMSDAMMEHYKSGFKEISGHMQSGFKTILAPMDAILGPLTAVGKSMFSIGKTLFSGPTKHEKETAKTQREIRDAIKAPQKEEKRARRAANKLRRDAWLGQKKHWLMQKKEWLLAKKDRLMEAAGRAVDKGKDAMAAVWKGLMMIGPALISMAVATWGAVAPMLAFVGSLILTALPFILIAVAVVALGLAIWYFWDEIKLFGTMVGDFISTFISGLWENLTSIWNNIFDFFDSLFSGDFNIGEKIMNMVTSMFNFIKKALISLVPGSSFFGWGDDDEDEKTTPDTNMPGSSFFGWGDDEKPTPDTNIPVGVKPGKSVSSSPSTTTAATAKAERVKEQIAVQKETQKELEKTNGSITENNQQQKSIMTNIQQNNTEKPADIPTENSDLGIMFSNATHGA